MPLEDRARYVVARMGELDKELSEKIGKMETKVGCFAMQMHLMGWRDILEGNPTGWEPNVRAWLEGDGRTAAPAQDSEKGTDPF